MASRDAEKGMPIFSKHGNHVALYWNFLCRPKSAQIPFMMPPSEENDIKAPNGILKVQVGHAATCSDS